MKDTYKKLITDFIDLKQRVLESGKPLNTYKLKTPQHAISLDLGDVDSCYGSNWLNGNVINNYLKHVLDSLTAEIRESIFIYNSEFNTEDSRNFTQDVNIFKKNLIIIPYNLNSNHWCLIIIDNIEKKIKYLDSLNKSNNKFKEIVSKIIEYLKKEHFKKNLSPLPRYVSNNVIVTQQATVIYRDKVYSEETNVNDCGVHMLIIADKIMNNEKNIIIKNCNIPYYRERIILTLLENKYLRDTTF